MKRTKRRFLLVPALIAAMLMPVAPAPTYAQEVIVSDLVVTALQALVKGFAGAAGNKLFGWMLGGGQASGTDQITDELDNISMQMATLNQNIINLELTLTCQLSITMVKDAASTIKTRYGEYNDFLSDMQDGTVIPVAGNDGSSLQGWTKSVLDSTIGLQQQMSTINTFAIAAGGAKGSIGACVAAEGKGDLYNTAMIDDRPYYKAQVNPILSWYVQLNAQAMIMLTEAYHFLATCPLNSSGDPTCTSVSQAIDLISTVCPPNSKQFNCDQPSTIYKNQFLPFVKGELKAGGAPYSTDDYVLQIGQNHLMATSLEAYTKANGNPDNCAFPLTSEKPCGLTVGKYHASIPSIAFGPYGYGEGTGNGTWDNGPFNSFTALFFLSGWNDSTAGHLASDALCTMDLKGTTVFYPKNCKQVNNGTGGNGGQGLSVGKKIVTIADEANCTENGLGKPCPSNQNSPGNPWPWDQFICFFDGNMPASPQPQVVENILGADAPFNMTMCQQNAGTTILGVLDVDFCIAENPFHFKYSTRDTLTSAGGFGSNVEWYAASAYQGSSCGGGVTTNPQWHVQSNTQEQYRWPTLSLDDLSKCDGKARSVVKNPAEALTMCGQDFDIWFNAQVPPNDSASLGEVTDAQAQGLGSQGGGTVRVKAEFHNRAVTDFRHVILRLDQVLFDGNLGGKSELVSTLDGTPLPSIELKPVRGAAGPNYGIYRTPYGEVPEVQVTLKSDKFTASPQNTLHLEMEITNATIDTPATCEVMRGTRVASLGTQLTIVNEVETILPVHPQWECDLRRDRLVLHDTAAAPTKAECKTKLGGCTATSP